MNYLRYYFVIITVTHFVICFRLSNSQLYEGDDCELENKKQGKCVPLSECPSAIEIVQKKEHPITCSYDRFTPIVCCPVQQAVQTRLSERKCEIYLNMEYTTSSEPPTTPFNRPRIEESSVDPNVPSAKLTDELSSDSPIVRRSIVDFGFTDILKEDELVRRRDGNNNTITSNNINDISLNTKAKLNSTFNENDKTNINEDIAIKINYTKDNYKFPAPIKVTIHNITQKPKLEVSEINLQPGSVYDGGNLVLLTESPSFAGCPIQPVIFGSIASDNEFPHMAAIGFTSGDAQLWRCGGSLISEKFVLTAAHCLSALEYGPAEWVSLGSRFVNLKENDLYPQQQVYKIIRRISHPKYKRPSSYNDIGLVELNQTVEFTRSVRPACLHASSVIDLKEQLTATGWGLTQFGGNGSEKLMKVNLDVYQREECLKIYEDFNGTRKLKNGIMQEEQFCAGDKQGIKDTCQGDSGGPLQIMRFKYNHMAHELASYGIVVGITSFGKSCGLYGVPGVYTRISQYLPWLESIVWPNES